MIINNSSKAKQLEDLIVASRLRLRRYSPFFAALALYAKAIFTRKVNVAATNGRVIFFHPERYGNLPKEERDAVFLHELLHAALLHPMRRGVRDQKIFNIAADIVVNGMVAKESNVELPKDAICDEQLEHLSVEEIYTILLKDPKSLEDKQNRLLSDLLDPSKDIETSYTEDDLEDLEAQSEIKEYWTGAIQESLTLIDADERHRLPTSFTRHLDEVSKPQIDWKTRLSRHLIRTPTDFSGFDRRFLYRGLYLEQLEGEKVMVFCCIDTSGSIGKEELSQFLGELKGILSGYTHLECHLWYADHDCYGPYKLESIEKVPKPKGGGGTNFIPFFQAIEKDFPNEKQAVCVYLTDGWGYYPEKTPELPVLWIINAGGLDSEEVPFGEVCRLPL
ncbi:DUF2201 family putative metallopeptidase [Prochlorococcus sp. MIT 1341]|uniref:vWA domain-containing protein n=1 Tax=Prochlorococcus sp. MIT 1341 TaxID=3096221 RepID=UPI002A7527BA|nr:VWA-like domain-containing protein [Prochlorococcus sp. MIT 1341]